MNNKCARTKLKLIVRMSDGLVMYQGMNSFLVVKGYTACVYFAETWAEVLEECRDL